eukprot:TRINITY_DN105014_c0_g1_i1.p1 TRINITY_DN105014_c0_g1~~TRINITY_DN105014_c0_g1_i1.p1  ORF type:complete len:241 (-),score=29.26 TRINITY_DN105014_c0_g1_i1:143-841(-)
MDATSAANVLSFFNIVGQLKNTLRTGWVHRKVKAPESVADHMYRMAMMAFIYPDDSIDRNKAIKMSLVHDIAEAITGDLTPWKEVNDSCGLPTLTKQEKTVKEKEALNTMKTLLQQATPDCAEELCSLAEEYMAGTSKEAKFVKDLDWLDMLTQAQEYEKAQQLDLSDFFQSADGKVKQHPLFSAVADIVRENHQQHIAKIKPTTTTTATEASAPCEKLAEGEGPAKKQKKN